MSEIRPRLFISAVSGELGSARRRVAATARTLGYDAISQDDFPTGHGELGQWLREQIDSCQGLLQIVGQAYGAEPPQADAVHARVSYTQLEFLHAQHKRLKTWVVMAGDGMTRDAPAARLDWPEGRGEVVDTAAYQAERQALQRDYVARLKADNHLRHAADSDAALENIVLRLRDDLAELRAAEIAWRTQDAAFKDKTTRQLDAIAEATRLTAEKIRAHLRETVNETLVRKLSATKQAADEEQLLLQQKEAAVDHAATLARIDELAASFAEIEGHGQATNVFREMTRILADQGVDQAIAYVVSQQASILQIVRARAEVIRERNRADLQPLLQTAELFWNKGQLVEASALCREVLALEPDWPAALHDFARISIAQARDARDLSVLQAIETRLQPLAGADAAVVVDLYLAYRDVGHWEGMIALAARMGEPLARSVAVQEQLGFALNRAGRRNEAARVLQAVIQQHGSSSETCCLLGRVYKDLWADAKKAGDAVLARGQLKKAIATYLQGFEADFRDAYPGINAVTLMEQLDPPDPRQAQLLPVVTYAARHRMAAGGATGATAQPAISPNYWDHATLLELAVLARDEAAAQDALADAVAAMREPWEPRTTANNLAMISQARTRRGEAAGWVEQITATLLREADRQAERKS